ncbi:uncharacterized protein LY79DRAFT_258452 [Colletotrichum navitas]|uniref:Uncharacterized protein n=1 Tax=Colletotrichum navitas TaxID=681940 RepID=A0AAD8V3H6_9PEZI|nr:uncharacterized protein LY79DRAFT_258452 [Colletotrichum navitas]KAK1585893.1 hypothetical protein LY79DRAFT_258452 [Colletotrichum navitas]
MQTTGVAAEQGGFACGGHISVIAKRACFVESEACMFAQRQMRRRRPGGEGSKGIWNRFFLPLPPSRNCRDSRGLGAASNLQQRRRPFVEGWIAAWVQSYNPCPYLNVSCHLSAAQDLELVSETSDGNASGGGKTPSEPTRIPRHAAGELRRALMRSEEEKRKKKKNLQPPSRGGQLGATRGEAQYSGTPCAVFVARQI